MPNIREVSRIARVSTATVSRALRQPQLVSQATRERVLRAVEKSGYRPNLLARNFSAGRSFTVVVLVPDITNPFFSRVIRGIEQEAQTMGYSVLLGDTQGTPGREQEYASLALTNQADGLIQLHGRYPFAEKDIALAAAVPMVNACERIGNECAYPVIELDNRGAAQVLTQHLLRLGHRRLGVITGPATSPLVQDRLAGFQQSLEAANITMDHSLVAEGDFSMPSGQKAATLLLGQKTPPTALFCMNDEMAIGAMHQCKNLGLRVPEDISVAGFDGIEFSSFTDPPLTTIKQPAEELGRQAMTSLYRIMTGRLLDNHQVKLPFELVARDSTGPASQ